MLQSHGCAAFVPQSLLRPFAFQRHEPGLGDIACRGFRHDGPHHLGKERQGSTFSIVPGREIVDKMVTVGAKMRAFQFDPASPDNDRAFWRIPRGHVSYRFAIAMATLTAH